MIDELLTTLRYKSEGTDIDFKSAQYRFTNGNEEDKAEMLKDILAIANSWREGTGYILLGFKDRRPHPAEVVGIDSSIDDSRVQQFVNGKVKPPLTFSYEEHLYEGRTIGLITIPKQKRPFYVSHAYGKVKSNVVYVRRGSSTSEAEPPEIAAMAYADSDRDNLRVNLSFLTPTNKELPDTFALRYLQIIERFPDFKTERKHSNGLIHFDVPSMQTDNSDFWREYAEYIRVEEGLIQVKFLLRNNSQVPLSNAKVEITLEPLNGQDYEMQAVEDLPDEPKTRWNALQDSVASNFALRNSPLEVDVSGDIPICSVNFGLLLPGEERRSSGLAIVLSKPGKLTMRSRILASELRTPIEGERQLETTGAVEELDFEGFKKFLKHRLAQKQS